jgi:hypothetical protein
MILLGVAAAQYTLRNLTIRPTNTVVGIQFCRTYANASNQIIDRIYLDTAPLYSGSCSNSNVVITNSRFSTLTSYDTGDLWTCTNCSFTSANPVTYLGTGSYFYSKQHGGNASDTKIWGNFSYTKSWQTRNTVGYWKFDEGSGSAVSDYTNFNNGTVSGANWTGGRFGRALRFDGNDDYVWVASSPSLKSTLGNGSFTMEAFFNAGLQAGINGAEIVEKYNPGPLLRVYSSAGSNYLIGYFLDNNWVTTNIPSAGSVGPLQPGIWHHVALVRDKANMQARLYLDGVLVGSSADATGDLSSDVGLYIGSACCSVQRFNGTIDEVRISNRALLPSEFLPFEHDSVISVMSGGSARVSGDAIMTFSNVSENGTFTSDGVLYRYKPYPIRVVNGSGSPISGASVNITDNFTGEFNMSVTGASGWVYPHVFQSVVNGSVLTTVKDNVSAGKAGAGWNSIAMNTTYGNQTISLGADQGFMIIGNLTNCSFTPNVTVGGSTLAGPYPGVRLVEIRNGSQIIVTFVHDFSADDLNLSTLTVRLGQYWVGFSGKPAATLYVPLRGSFCNVRACTGIVNTSETCTAGWNSADSDIQGWYCLTAVNGTVGEEQADPAITKLVAAPVRWELVAVLFAAAGAIVLAPKRCAKLRLRTTKRRRH